MRVVRPWILSRRLVAAFGVLALVSALLGSSVEAEVPDGEERLIDSALLLDDPNSASGIPDDAGDQFEGFGMLGSAAEVEKQGKSAISPNFDPNDTSRGDEPLRVGTAASIPQQEFPEGVVLGDIEAIRNALEQADREDGSETVRVLITARPNAGASADDMPARVARLAAIEEALAGTDSVVLHKGTAIPVMTVLISEAGLESALGTDATGGIELDFEMERLLASSTAVIGADITDSQQLHGGTDANLNPWEVAILDDGTLNSHDAFAGRIAAEACYTTDASCPNGLNVEVGPGAAAPNVSGHGTHVAGIAAGAETSFAGGVAQKAGIVAVDVFDADDLAYNSSIIGGIDFVAARELAGAKVAAMNLSLGSSSVFTTACDTFSPAMTTSIAAARAQGVLVVFAAGNSFSTTGVSFPSCITGSTTIANSTDTDGAAASTNINATLAHLWAPGSSITAAWNTSDSAYATLTGTSMAAPHVAGAAAALADCYAWDVPTSAPYDTMDDDILARMVATGVSVTDNRVGGTVTLPRLDLLAAATNLNTNDAFAGFETLSGTAGSNVDYSHCATEEVGEPSNNGVASTWYRFTAPNDGVLGLTTCDAYTTADTLIHVYTGTAVNSLTEIAEADDDASCSESTLHTTVQLPVVSGETYNIRVSVYDYFSAISSGKFRLSYSFANPTCNGLTATIVGTPGADVINGTVNDDVIVAGNGPDVVNGGPGNDTICLGNGYDTGSGGDGNDWISGSAGNDLILGDGGDDTILGGDRDDRLRGGDGFDSIFGNAGNDVLQGEGDSDYLSANAGDDAVYGGLGDDIMFGGKDNDRLWGSDGFDIMSGNDGDDTLYGELGSDLMFGRDGFDVMYGGDDSDEMYGGPDPDVMFGGLGLDIVSGNAGDDDLNGGGDSDVMYGGSGADLMRGGAGNDAVNGNTGDDDLRGNAGDDALNGGPNNDSCDGGPGTDTASATCEALVGIP